MHIVMLETTTPRGFHHIETLADAGIEVSFVTEDLGRYRSQPGYAGHHRATRVVLLPATKDVADLAGQLAGRLGGNPVDGVLCVHDGYLTAANQLARDLGVPHEQADTIELLRDKAAVRERLTDAGVGSLRWRRVDRAADAPAAAAAVGFPVVVKPLHGFGSVGVTVVWTARQLQEQLRATDGPLLIEQFAVGRHVSAELLVQDARPHLLGFAERLPTPPGVTAELGGHFPARFEGMGAARRFVTDLVAALGVTNSALHIELVVTACGVELVEVNARIAGHVVSEQMSRALDRSLTLDLLALCTGTAVRAPAEPVGALALRHFWTSRPGVLRSIEMPQLPAAVVRCETVVAPGDQVQALRSNFDRLGYVLTEAFSAEAAVEAADAVARQVRWDLAEDGSAPHLPDEPDQHGRHVLLLLDTDGAERILDAAGAATRHASVLWCGDGETGAAVREHWRHRYTGQWLQAPDAALADAVVKELHATDPVHAVVGVSPGLATLAETLRAVLAGAAPANQAQGTPPPATAGHVVVLLAGSGQIIPWAVFTDLGRDALGDRTLATAGDLPPDAREALVAAAAHAAAAAGIRAGVITCRRPTDRPVQVQAGADVRVRALCDAWLSQDIVSAAIMVALGKVVAPPRARRPAAVLRELAAPAGALRVADANSPAELYHDHHLAYVEVVMPTGHLGRQRHRPGGDRLAYVVTGDDIDRATESTVRIERGLRFRHTALERTHVLVVDRLGPAGWTRVDGTPVLPPDRFRVSVLTAHGLPAGTAAASPDMYLRADVFDQSTLTKLAEAVHAGHPVDRVACGTEHLLAPTAALRAHLGLPGDTPRQIRRVRDKAEMKRIAGQAGIPHAPGMVLYERADAERMLHEYGMIVVKPRDRSGAQGVHVIDNPAELDDWLRMAFLPGAQLVERYQAGAVLHIDAVIHDGVVAWEVSRYGDDAFGFAAGRPVTSMTVGDERIRGHARELLDRVLAAWDIHAGVVHLEAFDAQTHLVFCELAGRAGGGGVGAAFRITRGLDLRHAKLAIDAGDDPRRLMQAPTAPHAGWLVHYSPGGRLASYDDSEIAALAAYREVNAAVGDDVATAAFRGTGLSVYAFAGQSEQHIARLLERAATGIRFTFAPLDHPSTKA